MKNFLSKEFQVVGDIEELLPCPCCKFKTLQERGQYEICPACYWEDDGNNLPDEYSKCNRLTLKEAKDNFNKFGAYDSASVQFVVENPAEKYLK